MLKDSIGINSSSIQAQFDSVYPDWIGIDYTFDDSTGILNLSIVDVEEGNHVIRIIAENKNGNHTFPFYREITVLKK